MAKVIFISATGTTTWKCPPGCKSATIEVVGGGGGGGGGGSGAGSYYMGYGGNGGTGGTKATHTPVTLVPGTVYAIAIGGVGAQGASGTYNYNQCNNGGAGGTGGTSSITVAGTVYSGAGGAGGAGGSKYTYGHTNASPGGNGAAGSAPPSGQGNVPNVATAGTSGDGDGPAGGGNAGSAVNYGAGGGGGGGGGQSTTGTDGNGGTGGLGASGYLMITYVPVDDPAYLAVTEYSRFVVEDDDAITISQDVDTSAFFNEALETGTLVVTESSLVTEKSFVGTDSLGLIPDADDYTIDDDGNRFIRKKDYLTTVISDDSPLDYPYNIWDLPARTIYGKVEIQYTDPMKDAGVVVTSSGTAYDTFALQACDNQDDPSNKFLELDNGLLDGTYYLAPDTIKQGSIGWWSDTKAGTNATFGEGVWLRVDFTARPITELKVVGDSVLDEHPVDFTVQLYTAGDTLVHTETVTGNTLTDWSATVATHNDVVAMMVTITKWSKASACAKILELFSVYTETYEGDDLLQITLLEERDYQGASIPVGNISANEITVKFNNADRHFDPENPDSPIQDLIVKNRLIKAWVGVMISGTMEWISLGKFWSMEWDVPTEDIYAEVRGLDRLEYLRTSDYATSTVVQNTNLSAMATAVFTDAGLEATEYYIDPALADITVAYSWFDSMSHRDALKKIAEAGLAVVYCDRDGLIRMEIPVNQATSLFEFTGDNYFTREQPLAWNEMANYIVVEANPYVAGTAQQVFAAAESIVVPAGESVTVECLFNASPCVSIGTPALTGATNTHVESHTIYAWYSRVVLHNSGASPETITAMTIQGTPLVQKGVSRTISQDAASILVNGKCALATYSNDFIQTAARAKTIADALLAVYKNPRKDIIIETRGLPSLKLGDRFTAPLFETTTADYTVVRQSLAWDGGLNITVSGQRIPE